MKTAKSRQSNVLFSKSSLRSTFLLVKTGSCYGSWNMPEIILWVKGHCPPHLFHAVTSVWSVRLPFTWLVACMLAYFVFFTFIHMSHQRDEPPWSRVRNLIVRKVLTRFLCSMTSWFLRHGAVVSLCQVSHYQTTNHMPVPTHNLWWIGLAADWPHEWRCCWGSDEDKTLDSPLLVLDVVSVEFVVVTCPSP